MRNSKRIMIAAAKSGSGKTIFTCGLLRLLKRSGFDVGSFKCGPDFIDPMFHRTVLGVRGGNLDPFFCTHEDLQNLVAKRSEEYIVMEGAMGIYDGISGMGINGSCYEVASATLTPIILIIDAKGIGSTIASLIKGILIDDKEKLISGIILNRASKSYLESVTPLINEAIRESKSEAVIIGNIPSESSLKLESRHLGLKLPEEINDIGEQIDSFSDLIFNNCSLDSILSIMKEARDIPTNACYSNDNQKILTGRVNEKLRMAVAMDEAFCFYYEENLDALRDAEIEVVPFSPLYDSHLPKNVSGILIGGGYPELYLRALSENRSIKADIKNAIESGMPSLAECGGFMYLLDSIEDEERTKWPMLGVIEGGAYNTNKLSRFGYIELNSVSNGLIPSGEKIKGHEFHYFDSTNNGECILAEKASGTKSWKCCHMNENHIWGYPHLYYPSNPEFVERFVTAMRLYNSSASVK